MLAGKREVNIFNMSLMDILCGALGAFCFMTIALFPHYGRPKAAEGVQNAQQQIEQMQKQIEQMMQQLQQGGGGAAQTLQQLQQMQQQLSRMQQQLAQAQAQVQQLEQLLTSAEKKINDLEVRRPVVFQIWQYGERTGQDVDLYVQDPFQPPAAPPTVEKVQRTYRPGDTFTTDPGIPGSEVWLMRDMPAGEFKVYAKLMGAPATLKGASVTLAWLYGNGGQIVGDVSLTAGQRIGYFGNLVVDREGKMQFRVAPGVRTREAPKQGG